MVDPSEEGSQARFPGVARGAQGDEECSRKGGGGGQVGEGSAGSLGTDAAG